MKISFWYHVDEKLPKKSGTYVTFVGPTMASDDSGVTTSYWDSPAAWRENRGPHSAWANVVY